MSFQATLRGLLLFFKGAARKHLSKVGRTLGNFWGSPIRTTTTMGPTVPLAGGANILYSWDP